LLRRTLGDRVGPGQHASGVVDVHVLNQAAVDRVNASRVSATATATIGCSSRRDGIHTDDDPRLPTTRLYRRQITAFDPSATDNGDELSPVDHGMISSARTKNDWGIVSPSALAVLRLITSSNLVGCSTGRSAGLAPLRILSTNVAARRNMSV